jgi:hypothetical protein
MTRTTALLVLLTAAAPTVGATGISVSIAIPTRDGARRIAVGTAKPHLHVLVRNIVDTAQRIWDETFSLGYYALFFEIVGDDGAISTIRKKVREFTRNIPSSWTLEPGESFVFDVYLGDRSLWEGVPLPGPSCKTVRLRAVYEVTPDAESQRLRVWTGRVASKTEPVKVCQ